MSSVPTDPVLYEKIKQEIKARVNRWPSAYASGMLVQEYKRQMIAQNKQPYKTQQQPKPSPLVRWFQERWIDIQTNKPCGAVRSDSYYPTCRPSIKITDKTPVTASQLSYKAKASMIKQKQKAKKDLVRYKETHRYGFT